MPQQCLPPDNLAVFDYKHSAALQLFRLLEGFRNHKTTRGVHKARFLKEKEGVGALVVED